MEKDGGWVFISHSHKDVELVRKIRNYLEAQGLEPLMFYLKCLSDDNEIESLIKREIDERDWFIYADSMNARKSKWVQTEREYIEKSDDKTVFTIDLNDDLVTQLKQLEHISRQMTVYIVYARDDIFLQRKVKEKLLEKDMLVVCDEEIAIAGMSWEDSISNAISDVSKSGFCVLLITERSAKNYGVNCEVAEVARQGGKIIPVYVGETKAPEELLKYIGDLPGVHIDKEPTEEQLDRIMEEILDRVEFYEFDFKSSSGYQTARIIHLPMISRIDDKTFLECVQLECVYIPDSVIYISPDAFDKHPNILVKCTANSYAEQYCKRNGINYELC